MRLTKIGRQKNDSDVSKHLKRTYPQIILSQSPIFQQIKPYLASCSDELTGSVRRRDVE